MLLASRIETSYKYFEKDQFLEDIGDVDWSEVLACRDLDEAVTCFTLKFKNVLKNCKETCHT